MIITVYYSEAGDPVTGLSPTIDIRDVSDGSLDIDDGAMSEIGSGWYKYDFSGATATKQYVWLCDGGVGLCAPERYIPGEWILLQADWLDGGRLDLILDAMGAGGISISVSDQLTTVENIGPNLPLAGVLKFDSINITEFKSLLTTIAPSIFENMTVTEFVQFLISIKPNLFETITIQEVVTLLKDFGIEQHDQVTIAEVVSLVINLLFSTHDIVTITENIQAALSLLDFEISKHETITIQEVVTLLKDFNIEKYDSITINEIVTLVMNIIFSGHDTVTITENIQAALSALDVEISEFETINITEFVSAALSGIIAMNRFELINILESVQAEIRLAGIETHDILNITESILLTIPVSFSLHDVVHIAENITLSMPDLATSQDLVNITESIIVGLDSMLFSSFDSVAISESITMLLEWLGALPLGNFTAKSRAYAFTAKSRTYAYTARSRLQ